MRTGAVRLMAIALLAAVQLMPQPRRAQASALPEAIAAGHRMAVNWCAECHAVERGEVMSGKGPAFQRIADMPSTTELSLKVFLRSNHANMPNFIIAPGDADEIARYILSLKRN